MDQNWIGSAISREKNAGRIRTKHLTYHLQLVNDSLTQVILHVMYDLKGSDIRYSRKAR